ncbi:MAG: hypothetical protein MZU95_15630 [Desulfomicrobium escambiense]|nr:hypothetical protein [Desulfomicrobium escambiense]
MFGGTYTACVSSQVGCARACAFCETGRGGTDPEPLGRRDRPARSRRPREPWAYGSGTSCSWAWGSPWTTSKELFGALGRAPGSPGPGILPGADHGLHRGPRGGSCGALRGLGLKRLNLSVSLAAARDETPGPPDAHQPDLAPGRTGGGAWRPTRCGENFTFGSELPPDPRAQRCLSRIWTPSRPSSAGSAGPW